MLYQIVGIILPFILAADIILIGIIVLSTNPTKKLYQRITYGLAILGFIGLGLFKLLFIVPHAIPSTPVDLKIKTTSTFTTLYYLGDFNGETKVFWKEHIVGHEKEQYFDLESSIADGLTIASKHEGTWYSKKIQLNWDEVAIVSIDRGNFKRADQEIINAIKKYRWIESGNYLSNLLTVCFLITLIWRIKIHGP